MNNKEHMFPVSPPKKHKPELLDGVIADIRYHNSSPKDKQTEKPGHLEQIKKGQTFLEKASEMFSPAADVDVDIPTLSTQQQKHVAQKSYEQDLQDQQQLLSQKSQDSQARFTAHKEAMQEKMTQMPEVFSHFNRAPPPSPESFTARQKNMEETIETFQHGYDQQQKDIRAIQERIKKWLE